MSHFKFFEKFAGICASQGAPLVSRTPMANLPRGVNHTGGCSAQTQTRMGCLRKSPEVEFDSYRWLSHLGVRAPYAARRKRRYEANQVWMNTTFILQGPQSWGKLAVETWRVKTELIIITILHIIIIITSILNLGFKTIAPKILAHIKCINKYWKYTQIFAATKPNQAKLIAKNHQILALAQNIHTCIKYWRLLL
jgi:hypothetical protein